MHTPRTESTAPRRAHPSRPRLHLRRLLLPLTLALSLLITFLAVSSAIGTPADDPNPLQLASAAPTLRHSDPASPAPARIISPEQCIRCHTVDASSTHPTRVAPSMTVPAFMPLKNGQITCTTCHLDAPNDHSQAAIANNPFLLRGNFALNPAATSAGPEFCTQCHTSAASTRAAQHPIALSKAHLSWPKSTPHRPLPSPQTTVSASLRTASVSPPHTAFPTADDNIHSCLSCHDGTIASDAFGSMRAAAARSAPLIPGSPAKNHPVGITYTNSRFLTPIPALDYRTPLTNGQVTCTSCHNLYSPEKSLLAINNHNSALCTSCHLIP